MVSVWLHVGGKLELLDIPYESGGPECSDSSSELPVLPPPGLMMLHFNDQFYLQPLRTWPVALAPADSTKQVRIQGQQSGPEIRAKQIRAIQFFFLPGALLYPKYKKMTSAFKHSLLCLTDCTCKNCHSPLNKMAGIETVQRERENNSLLGICFKKVNFKLCSLS